MTLSPLYRKFALTAHVTFSVGWLGAVSCFLALAITGLVSHDPGTARAAYVAMGLTGWLIILPLSFASPLTGFILSFGTTWGFFRHYWLVAKIVITIPSTLLLLLHMQGISHMSQVTEITVFGDHLHGLRIQLLVDAASALVVLVVATALSVFKPSGLTPYGWRKQQQELRLRS